MQNNPYLQPYQAFPSQNLISNPFSNQAINRPVLNTLQLNQIEGITPAKEFTDEMNIKWSLIKAASDSTIDIPSPKTVQFTDCWCHQYLNIDKKVYVYVVEGIRMPRVETEQPSRVLYQWYSTVCINGFNPQMITEQEWLKANVYSAPGVNARMSKLNAFCPVPGGMQPQQQVENKPIYIEGLSNGSTGNAENNS